MAVSILKPVPVEPPLRSYCRTRRPKIVVSAKVNVNSHNNAPFAVLFANLHLKCAFRSPKQHALSCKQLHVSRRFLQVRNVPCADLFRQLKKDSILIVSGRCNFRTNPMQGLFAVRVASKYGESLSNCPVIEFIRKALASGFQSANRVVTHSD